MGVGAVAFIAAGIKWLSPADVHCIVGPMIRPFLRVNVATLEAVAILENLKKPVGSCYCFMGYHSDVVEDADFVDGSCRGMCLIWR